MNVESFDETRPLLGERDDHGYYDDQQSRNQQLAYNTKSKADKNERDVTVKIFENGRNCDFDDSAVHARRCEDGVCRYDRPVRKKFNANKTIEVTYWNLLKGNRPFSLYAASFFITQFGEWFTYVASISAIERFVPDSTLAISALIIVRQIPQLFFSAFGGVLSDSWDRRVSMIVLDSSGAAIVLMYLLAMQLKSAPLIYVVAFLQQTIAAFYEPVRMAIVPLLVTDEDFLKKAMTLTSIAWSVMAALGSSIGGLFAAQIGLEACFVVDSFTYAMSALLMCMVRGRWTVADKMVHQEEVTVSSVCTLVKSMMIEGLTYVKSSFFGPLVFIKATGALVAGATDILNVSFSKIEDNEDESSRRLGILFGCVGLGCFIGPLLADRLTEMKRPQTLQTACIVSVAVMAAGCALMGTFEPFWCVCFSVVGWSLGWSVLWTDSSLLLQKFSIDEMYGRVAAVDFTFARLSEAGAALIAGMLEDVGFSPAEVSWFFGFVVASLCVMWYVFDRRGGGAAGFEEKVTPDGKAIARKRASLIDTYMDTTRWSWVSVTRASMVGSEKDDRRWSWIAIEDLADILDEEND